MMLKLWGGSGPWTGNGRTQRGCGAKCPLCSVSRRSPPLGQLTLAAIKESVGAATIAGAKGGNARFSGPWTLADPVGHSYDCFLAARTHRPDPLQTKDSPGSVLVSSRSPAGNATFVLIQPRASLITLGDDRIAPRGYNLVAPPVSLGTRSQPLSARWSYLAYRQTAT